MTLVGADVTPDVTAECLAGALVDHVEDPQLPAVDRAVGDEVVAPHMVGVESWQVLGSPGRVANCLLPARFRPLRGHLQPLRSPEPLHSLAVDLPALLDHGGVHHAVAPASMVGGDLGHPRDHLQLEVSRLRDIPLGRPMLSEKPAGPALADAELRDQVHRGVPAPRRGQNFPLVRSLSIEMSNACSAMIRFSRAFSCSSALSRCASSSFNAPYFVRHR